MISEQINMSHPRMKTTYNKVYDCLSTEWKSLADIAEEVGESYQRVRRFIERMPDIEKRTDPKGKPVYYRLKGES